jgi:hypothetical protein
MIPFYFCSIKLGSNDFNFVLIINKSSQSTKQIKFNKVRKLNQRKLISTKYSLEVSQSSPDFWFGPRLLNCQIARLRMGLDVSSRVWPLHKLLLEFHFWVQHKRQTKIQITIQNLFKWKEIFTSKNFLFDDSYDTLIQVCNKISLEYTWKWNLSDLRINQIICMVSEWWTKTK